MLRDVCSSLCDRYLSSDHHHHYSKSSALTGMVNFYQPGDRLGAHVDMSEKRMDCPLVSISLGASCVFLMGGETRDHPVTPLILHSGDVIFLTGGSRKCFHGVPTILDPPPIPLLPVNEEQQRALFVLGSGRINLNIRVVE